MRRVLLVVLSVFFVFTNIESNCVFADEKKQYDIEVNYSYNNNPIYSIQIIAKNYENAKNKLMKGDFKESDFKHFSVSKLKSNYRVENEKVFLNNKLKFGKNLKTSYSEAKDIISELYKTNLDYLDFINDFGPQITLSNPENTKYKFTNKEGNTIGKIEGGLTLFVSSIDTKDFEIKNINSNQKISLGNTDFSSGIFIKTNDKKSKKKLSVDYGETVEYHIPISNKTKLRVDISPNFVIDSVNLPYEKELNFSPYKIGKNGLLENDTELEFSNNIIYYNSSENTAEEQKQVIEKELSKFQSIYRYNFDFKNIDKKFLIIKGHVVSNTNYQIKAQRNLDANNLNKSQEKLNIENSRYKQGILVSDGQKYYFTPYLTSYKVNFAMFNSNSNKLYYGGNYILGRIDENNQIGIYSGSKYGKPKWSPTKNTNDFSKHFIKKYLRNRNNYFQIRGGSRYTMDGLTQKFELNKKIWDFNIKEQRKISKSLFTIEGLSSNYKYFLLQTKVPKGYELRSERIDFIANINSKSYAQYLNYEINGQILDFEYGQNEYNAIPLNKKNKKINTPVNPYILLALGLLIVLFIYLFTVFLLINPKNKSNEK